MGVNGAARAVVGVGIDLVAVATVRQAIECHGPRYLERVYTATELEDCRDLAGATDPTRLAARFAAKEATMKVLRVQDEPLPWTSIGVVRAATGEPSIELSAQAAALAHQRGVTRIAVSLSHEGSVAAAIAVGEGTR